jgi:hypothetical protein
LSVKLADSYETDELSFFIDYSRHDKYVIYNRKEEMEYTLIAKIIKKHLCQLLASKTKKFNFNNTSEIKEFMAKMQSN